MMKGWWMWRVIKFVLVTITALLVFGLVVMLLWNAIVPDVFKGPAITFWQAAGLLLLSHILLRGWGPWRHRNGWRHERWRKRFEERLAAMSPEEREKYREGWKRRCGWYPGEPEEKKEETKS